MKVFVTGDTSSLFKHIIKQGLISDHEITLASEEGWRLGSWVSNSEKYDFCLHFAFSRNIQGENFLGTRILAEQFKERLIYISSISAHIESKSEYGITKFRCEQIVKMYLGQVISPGVFLTQEIAGLGAFLSRIPSIYPNFLIPFSDSVIALTDAQELVNTINVALSSKPSNQKQTRNCYSEVTTIRNLRSGGRKISFYPPHFATFFWSNLILFLEKIIPVRIGFLDKIKTIGYPPKWLEDEFKFKNKSIP
jgi:hypothetical protein